MVKDFCQYESLSLFHHTFLCHEPLRPLSGAVGLLESKGPKSRITEGNKVVVTLSLFSLCTLEGSFDFMSHLLAEDTDTFFSCVFHLRGDRR